MGLVFSQFVTACASLYAFAIKEKSDVLHYCIAFIDGEVNEISRPVNHDVQHTARNCQNRKYALIYQTIINFDGSILNVYG